MHSANQRRCALVDAVYDWARFNSVPRGYGWIRLHLEDATRLRETIRLRRRKPVSPRGSSRSAPAASVV